MLLVMVFIFSPRKCAVISSGPSSHAITPLIKEGIDQAVRCSEMLGSSSFIWFN